MMRLRRPIVVSLVMPVLVLSIAVVSHAKKKKKTSPTARAKNDYPKVKQAYADARLVLYRAQYALARAMREADKLANVEKGKVDRTGFAAALNEHREARTHVEQLLERTRQKLSKENKAYIKATSALEAAQARYNELSSADPANPRLILQALNAIKAPSQAVGDIEQTTLAANDYFQKAVEREEDARQTLVAERANLLRQMNNDAYDETTRAKLIEASATVSKARLDLGQKSTALSRLSQILEPNNVIRVGITRINQNPKRKPKKRGNGKGKKK